MEHRAVRGAVGEQHLDHLVVRVAVVDLQREAQLLGQRDVRAERLALDLPARAARRGSGPGRSRRWRGCGGWRARSARRARSRPSSADVVRRLGVEPVRRRPRRCPRGGPPRSGGWRPRRAAARGRAPPSSVHAIASRSQPTWTIRVTPTAAARSRCVRRAACGPSSHPSASPRRPPSRGACGCRRPATGSGSGGAGQPRSVFDRAITPGAAARAPPRRSSRRAW